MRASKHARARAFVDQTLVSHGGCPCGGYCAWLQADTKVPSIPSS